MYELQAQLQTGGLGERRAGAQARVGELARKNDKEMRSLQACNPRQGDVISAGLQPYAFGTADPGIGVRMMRFLQAYLPTHLPNRIHLHVATG